MNAPDPAAQTLTIEYLDDDGQVQRVEQLRGSHFTLRVSGDAAAFLAPPQGREADAPPPAAAPPAPAPHRAWLIALALYGIYALLSSLDVWVEYNPDNNPPNYVIMALGITAALALWAAVWSLFSKIFAKHANYWQHVSIVLAAGIALTVVASTMHFLSFSLSWRVLGRIDNLTLLATLGLMMWAHLRLIVPPTRGRPLGWSVLALTLLGLALLMWTNHRRQGSVLDTLHTAHLYRPALQLTTADPSIDFFSRARALEAPLKAQADEVEPGEDPVDSDDDD
ncbi:MAG: hypothetical protein KIS62_12910 [Ramlibacter sp.]|nr:hypothetical protein [Ramlibacter sp.]